MNSETHSQLANFIWSICNLLRGPYKRNEYRKVILPLTVLRRFDCLLAPTKAQVLAEHPKIKTKPETVVRSLLEKITRRPFYNLSKLDLPKLLDDPNQLAPNLNAYINGFSKNVREIMERFAFDQQIARMAEKNLLYEVIKKFAAVDLVARPRGQRPDGLRLRGAHSDRRRAVERGGRRALHPARGDQADGQPPALAGAGPAQEPRGQDDLRPGLRYRRHALGGREVHPRPERRGRSAPLRPGLERRVLGGLQVRHADQGRGRRQHRPRRHLHEGRFRPRRRRQEAHLRLHAGESALRRGVEAAAEVHRARGASRSVTTAASARDCHASTTARCSSCSTCSRRCGLPRMVAAGSASCSMARRSSPATLAAARATSASGSSRTTGSKPSSPCRTSSSTTLGSPPTSGCSPTARSPGARARSSSSTRGASS